MLAISIHLPLLLNWRSHSTPRIKNTTQALGMKKEFHSDSSREWLPRKK